MDEQNTSLSIEQVQAQLKRALADYANLQKRTEKEKEEFVKYSNEVLLTRLVGVLDGFEMILREFVTVLAENGFQITNIAPGQEFDPNTMEAVESDSSGNVVTGILSQGYTLYGKIIRPARVRVGSIKGDQNA